MSIERFRDFFRRPYSHRGASQQHGITNCRQQCGA